MTRSLKQNDVLELSKLYEAEFNKPELHDRVLVFDVVRNASWQRIPNIEENERIENEARSNQSENKLIENETTRTEIVETECNEKAETKDCEIVSKYGEHNQKIEDEASNPGKDNEITAESNENDDTTLNKNVETIIETSDPNETIAHTDDANPTLNNAEQNEDISEAESYEPRYPTNEENIIRQHKFFIHSSWLAVQSSYFRSLFFSGMKESNTKEVHVQISTCEERAHLMLLEAMYKIDTLDNASVDELLEALLLAHKYDVKYVFKKCKYCLQAAVISLEICEKIMRFVKIENTILTNIEDLLSTLQAFLAKEFSPLDKTWQTRSFKELCEPSLRYLLSSDELVAESENTVFHALVYWIEQRGLQNVVQSQGNPSLLSVIRFELIPIDYLYNIVQHNPVARKMADFNHHYLRGISYHALSSEIRERVPRQPVNRKARTTEVNGTQSFIAYTWVIQREEFDELVGTDKELKSDEFWFCGYRMLLKLSHVLKSERVIGQFSGTLNLEIVNLTQQSAVTISWQPASTSFNSGHLSRMHTFKNDAHESSVDVKYEIFDPVTQGGKGTLTPSLFGSTFGTSLFAAAPAPAKPCLSFGSTISTKSPLFSTGLVPKQNSAAFNSGQATSGLAFSNAQPITRESSTPHFQKPISPTPCLSIDVKITLQ